VGQAPGAAQARLSKSDEACLPVGVSPRRTRYPDCLTEPSQSAILDWCRQHGLLGVLLSRWEAISLAPHHEGRNRWVQRRYLRGFGQVIQMHETSGDVEEMKASVLIHALNDLVLVEEPPHKTWSRFFPTVELSQRDSFPYPIPYSDDFCRLYGERLIEICNAAKLLVGVMLHLGRKPPKIDGDPQLAREEALDAINILRQPVTSVLQLDAAGTGTDRWVAPSLLASFAEMFAQDLAYGRPTLQCISCGTPFVSSAYQALYLLGAVPAPAAEAAPACADEAGS
jgi:hypothetical protein